FASRVSAVGRIGIQRSQLPKMKTKVTNPDVTWPLPPAGNGEKKSRQWFPQPVRDVETTPRVFSTRGMCRLDDSQGLAHTLVRPRDSCVHCGLSLQPRAVDSQLHSCHRISR